MIKTERGWWLLAVVVAFLLGLWAEGNSEDDWVHSRLCPTILAQSPTAADSLAVFQKHEGCFEFVQREAP